MTGASDGDVVDVGVAVGDTTIVQRVDPVGGQSVQHLAHRDFTALAGLPCTDVLRVIEQLSSEFA